VVENRVAKIHARRQLAALVQVFVDRVTSGEHNTGISTRRRLSAPGFFSSVKEGKFDHDFNGFCKSCPVPTART